jgi:hypothetical protein
MPGRVRIVAILLLSQGALNVLVGLYGFLTVPLWAGLKTWLASPEGIMLSVAIGLGQFVAGVVLIIAGARNLKCRNRSLGLVALVVGALPLGPFSVVTMPTGIGLFVYGLRVYRDERIKRAFAREDRSSQAGRNVRPS